MRHFRVFLAVLTLVALVAIPSAAMAGGTGPVEIQAVTGVGGPIGLIGANYPGGGITTYPFTTMVAGRLGLPDYTSARLELSFVIPCGMGGNLLLDVVNTKYLRLHIIDPGIFWNAVEPVSVTRLHRSGDFTFGAGVDVKVTGNWAIGVDWRWFLPNPVNVLPDYKDFSTPMYNEAIKGGQLWASISYTF